jgi:sigma-B regulation protein RsbU (phosphoserine phosphatase)
MDSDKNLTLCLLDYRKGTIYLTGQHEDVLLVRQGGKIERIDTTDLGFIVGIKADISRFTAQLEIRLQPGDGLVLYTDGITEAFDESDAQYGIDRLCEMVSQYWHLTASEIQKAIITDVRRHIHLKSICDDITLLVLKQR